MLQSEATSNLQNDRLTLLMNAEHDVSPSVRGSKSFVLLKYQALLTEMISSDIRLLSQTA